MFVRVCDCWKMVNLNLQCRTSSEEVIVTETKWLTHMNQIWTSNLKSNDWHHIAPSYRETTPQSSVCVSVNNWGRVYLQVSQWAEMHTVCLSVCVCKMKGMQTGPRLQLKTGWGCYGDIGELKYFMKYYWWTDGLVYTSSREQTVLWMFEGSGLMFELYCVCSAFNLFNILFLGFFSEDALTWILKNFIVMKISVWFAQFRIVSDIS